MSSIHQSDEADTNFDGQEYLNDNVYIDHLGDEGAYGLNAGYDPPGSVFQHAADENIEYYVDENATNSIDANNFEENMTIAPPTLDVIDAEVQPHFDVAYDSQPSTDEQHHVEAYYEEMPVTAQTDETVNLGASSSADGNYINETDGFIVFQGVEGRLLDQMNFPVQFFDSNDQPITHYNGDLPEGVRFISNENLVDSSIFQYVDEYGNFVNPPTDEVDEDYFLVDEYGNEVIVNNNDSVNEQEVKIVSTSSPFFEQPKHISSLKNAKRSKIELSKYNYVCGECNVCYPRGQYRDFVKHLDFCVSIALIQGIDQLKINHNTQHIQEVARLKRIANEQTHTNIVYNKNERHVHTPPPELNAINEPTEDDLLEPREDVGQAPLLKKDEPERVYPKVECPYCGLMLQRHNFRSHHRIHTGELPFLCQICEKGFRTTSALRVHFRSHTGERPYSCLMCSYATITKRNLDRHVYNNHIKENAHQKDVGNNDSPPMRRRRGRYRPFTDTSLIEEIQAQHRQNAFNSVMAAIGRNDVDSVIAHITSDVAKHRDIEGRSLLQLAFESNAYPICEYLIRRFRGCYKPDEWMRWLLAIRFSSSMARVLCVAEKNDAAKNIALQLSGNHFQRAEGHSKYNKIYLFNGNFQGQPAKFVMTSVSGHLMTLDFGQGYKEWRPATIGELFSAPVIRSVNSNMLPIEQTLKEQSRGAEILIIWTDCDREGENIGAEIVSVCLSVNSRLDVYRARFSEITYHAVTRALNNVIRLDQNEVDAVDCRSELDLRIGAAFTRLQTLHLQSTVPTVVDGVVSYGSCQFPTLGFVVERYKAIKEFVSEPFWRLVGKHKRNGVDVEFSWIRNRLFIKEVTEMFHEVCNDASYATVTHVQKAPKSRWRPVALDTVEFEKLAVRKLRMSAKDAMAAAERLYTSGYVSYPRTETNIFPKELNLSSLVTMQGSSPDWGAFAQDIMTRGGPNPRNGSKTDEAHPPIHTLKLATKQEITRDWAVYELITRHFLACVSRNATGQSTTVKVNVSDEIFTANGIVIENRGYLDVYKYDNWQGKMLPAYRETERLTDFKVDINEGSTSPPLLLNEADLIALMDKHGIGTDATHAEHIEKIKERQYVALNNDKRFIPGFLGLSLVDAYNEMGFEMSKPILRSTLERGLVDICNGTRSKADVLAEQLQSYKRIFNHTEDRIIMLSDIFKRYLGNRGLAGAATSNTTPARGGRGTARGGRGSAANRASTRGRASREGRSNGSAAAGPLYNFPTVRVQNAPNQSSRPPPAPGPRPVVQIPQNSLIVGNGNSNPIVCGCGVPAPVRTANTAANRGRKFYGCAKQRDDPTRCNFFQWET